MTERWFIPDWVCSLGTGVVKPMRKRNYSLPTIKTLFALSCNHCCYPGCDQALTRPEWDGVVAEIAHIRGLNQGSARHDPQLSVSEANSVENLLLMCPTHHTLVDHAEPDRYSTEELTQWKERHESSCLGRPTRWATDDELVVLARLFLRDVSSADSSGRRRTPRSIPQATIKALFAQSGNVCSFPGCRQSMVDEDSGAAIGEVAYIRSPSERGPRFDPLVPPDRIDDISNLLLLCPTHHKMIDEDLGRYSVAVLDRMRPGSKREYPEDARRIIDLVRDSNRDGSRPNVHDIALALGIDSEEIARQVRALIDSGELNAERVLPGDDGYWASGITAPPW